MKYKLILLFTVLFFPLQVIANDNDSCKQVANQSDTCCFSRFTDSSAMKLVEKTEQNARQAYIKREEQRNQLMGLTITVLVGIVGFALSKELQEPKHKYLILLMGVFFCLFMHAFDTSLEDLSNRQLAYGNRLNYYLLQWDSLRVDEVKSALMKVRDGNECNDTFEHKKGWERKLGLFFCGGMFLAMWWWALTIAVGLLLFHDGFVWARLKTWWKEGKWKKIILYTVSVVVIVIVWRILCPCEPPEHRCYATTHTDKHK